MWKIVETNKKIKETKKNDVGKIKKNYLALQNDLKAIEAKFNRNENKTQEILDKYSNQTNKLKFDLLRSFVLRKENIKKTNKIEKSWTENAEKISYLSCSV